MKMAFGLIGLLGVVAAVVFWLAAPGGGLDHQQAALEAGQQAREQINVLGGKSPDGQSRAVETVDLQPTYAGGDLDALLVRSIGDASPLVATYGLRDNDVIIQVGPQPINGGMLISTFDEAVEHLELAYSRGQPIKVVRDGQTLTLPDDAASESNPREPEPSRGRALDSILNRGVAQ